MQFIFSSTFTQPKKTWPTTQRRRNIFLWPIFTNRSYILWSKYHRRPFQYFQSETLPPKLCLIFSCVHMAENQTFWLHSVTISELRTEPKEKKARTVDDAALINILLVSWIWCNLVKPPLFSSGKIPGIQRTVVSGKCWWMDGWMILLWSVFLI